MSIKKFFINNFWLKLISLILAIGMWFYISKVISQSSNEKKVLWQDMLASKTFISKTIPIRADLRGTAQNGYIVNFKKVVTVPKEIVIIGPKTLISDIDSIKTEKIDIGEYTRTKALRVRLAPQVKGLGIEGTEVTVEIPVEKVQQTSIGKK